MNFEQARDWYIKKMRMKSRHTLAAYRQACNAFIAYLKVPLPDDRLPIHEQNPPTLDQLTRADAPMLLSFANWMKARGYKKSTIALRTYSMKRWLQLLDDYELLPADFPMSKSVRMVNEAFGRNYRAGGKGAPEPKRGIEELLTYYATLAPPDKIQKLDPNHERARRWEITRKRNHALIACLAESAGRVSEVLSLNVDDFPVRDLERQDEVVRITVTGKGDTEYSLRFLESLPAVKDYINARGASLMVDEHGKVPLFVNHAPAHASRRISRYTAWHVVNEAADALGIGHVHPHDFRHWRASQLVNAGVPIAVVQDYLGHGSVETTKKYYAATSPVLVDDATKNVRPNDAISVKRPPPQT